jgi:carbon-monoxide dehydrogenase medium subunit
MIPQNFDYDAPDTLQEVLAMVASGAKPLAGGHSLIPLMKLRLALPERLVDLRRLGGLNAIRAEDGAIRIGAMATHHDIEASNLLRGSCPLLAETASHIGDPQVRNMGTIGGSVAHADPASDYPAALMALEAKVHLASTGGERTIPVADFFLDTFTTALEPGEIILDVIVPAERPATGVSYQKVEQPASGFAIVGVAARVRVSGGRVEMCRAGITGLTSKAYRPTGVERLMEGSTGSEADIEKAALEADAGADANSDLHASADYRRHLARVSMARALRAALARTA